MAWTSPRTWVDAETVTAALLNTHVRDNLLETAPAKVTTKGDIVAATGANAVSRLGVGGNGALLVADSAATTGIRWSGTSNSASAGVAYCVQTGLQATATANNDVIYGFYNALTVAKGGFTGLQVVGINAAAPGTSGSGSVANAYNILAYPPTVGASNWTLYLSGVCDTYLGDANSQIFIGCTSNSSQVTGLTTMNSGDASESIGLKSSGLAHGVTTYADTDTYASLRPRTISNGGLLINGFNSKGSADQAVVIRATVATADTTKSTAAVGAMEIRSTLASGTSSTSLGANTNLLTISDTGTVRFIFDADGDSHEDVGTTWTNFDDHDDAALLNLLSAHVTRRDDPLRDGFREWLAQGREQLEAARLVSFDDDLGSVFVNRSRLQMLLVGAVRQMSTQIQAQAQEIGTLKSTVKLLTA